MKVNSSNSDLQDYMKRLDSKLHDQTVTKENEIDNIKKYYEKKIQDTKAEGEEGYLNSVQKNDSLLVSASKDFEDKLNNYKENLDRAHKTITREENELKTNHGEILASEKNQFQNIIKDLYQNANENQNTTREETNASIQAFSENAQSERNQFENSSQTKLNNLASEYNQRGITNEREYRKTLENDLLTHKDAITIQKNELQKAMDKMTEQNKRLEGEKRRVQTAEINYLDNHQKDILSQKQSDFKVRYENLVKEHETLLADLKTHFETDVKKMVEKNAKQKEIMTKREDDKFYKLETLNPKIVESENEVHVSLNVPEYEKENVHLSVQGRGMKITLTRKYSDAFDDEEGNTNKSNRSELFSTNLSSKDFLNQNKITQNYDKGILNFKIQKL